MKTRSWKILVLAFCVILLCSASLSFSKSSPKNSHKNLQSSHKASETDVRIDAEIFIGKDRDSIRRYFHTHAGSLPPGLAKRGGDLPPGLQKQLQRKGKLPPGLAKKIAAFPVELERRLPPLKQGLVRGVIEGRAVIFNAKTSVILDIFSIF
ncbi:MAG: hypothetical protein JXR49_14305 [Acidobacteria bacterium]|nr:hypothetical protein [Acidobacteriota bacterium]